MELNDLPAFRELHAELSKTAVISDQFKDYLIGKILEAAEEATHDSVATIDDQKMLRVEFQNRRFTDKTAVKLGARTFMELLSSLKERSCAGVVFGDLFDLYCPDQIDCLAMLLTGSYEDVIAAREWLWRNIDEQPVQVCEAERKVGRIRKS